MDDCKSNHSSSKSPPLHPLQLIDYSSIASRDYNSGRLSKVTEENSNSNNTTNSLWDEQDEKETNSSTPCPESLSLGAFDSRCPPSTASYIHYLQQVNRHNNTPHYNENIEEHSASMIFNEDRVPFIPERIRMLLDRFASNGYIQSNAPPPATKTLIESIPERVVAVEHNSDEIMQCAICMLQVFAHDVIRTLPCAHYFHSKCIVTWLHIHASCPLCRYQLQTNININNNGVAPSETERETLSESRATNNRLQDLRRRRWNRSTLRNTTTTPISEENDSDDMHQAATQLIEAVCDILKQYKQRTQNVNIDDISRRNIDERVVRFNMRRPPPPHSSRSNTKTRNSLNDLHSPLFRYHAPSKSSPAHKLHSILRLNDLDRECSVEQKENNEDTEIISAKKIKQEFAKWMKRRSQLDCSKKMAKSPELTPDSSSHRIIYNQNYIYNDEDDVKWSANNNNYNTSHPTTPSHILLSAECSNQTMVERQLSTPYFSGEIDDDDDIDEHDVYDMLDGDNNDIDSVFAAMTAEQLEIAEKRHKNIIYQQQCAIDEIQNEQNKRMLNSYGKCPQCRSNPSAYLFLPCRHLGVCLKCNSLTSSTKMHSIQKCSICHVCVRQQILINFD